MHPAFNNQATFLLHTVLGVLSACIPTEKGPYWEDSFACSFSGYIVASGDTRPLTLRRLYRIAASFDFSLVPCRPYLQTKMHFDDKTKLITLSSESVIRPSRSLPAKYRSYYCYRMPCFPRRSLS